MEGTLSYTFLSSATQEGRLIDGDHETRNLKLNSEQAIAATWEKAFQTKGNSRAYHKQN
jgi:hypothetical protein